MNLADARNHSPREPRQTLLTGVTITPLLRQTLLTSETITHANLDKYYLSPRTGLASIHPENVKMLNIYLVNIVTSAIPKKANQPDDIISLLET